MRIQHNIMAMNAYRNYTNNVSAMKQNLEKLSSGYKINRAGDDAAGLAISEKMRAQITGLETAQKNAKDGISLVQTAEGALTEVHDMLNRMVELATQSANGTYDNTTDRYQLQKEVDQLKDEINRIADSANFNGIKLLDGSMETRNAISGAADVTFVKLMDGQQAGKAAQPGIFKVDMSQSALRNASTTGEIKVTFTAGSVSVAVSVGKDGKLEGADVADAVYKELKKKAEANTLVDKDGNKFDVSLNGSELTFTMKAEPTVRFNAYKGFEFKAEFPAADGTGSQGTEFHVTTVQEPISKADERIYAKATMKLDDSIVKDGGALKIGDTTYVFAIGANSKYKNYANVIDLTDKTIDGDKADLLNAAASRLTQVAADNKNFIVGSDLKADAGGATITFTEREGGVDYNVNNLAGTDGKSDGKWTETAAGNRAGGKAGTEDWAGLIQFGSVNTSKSANGLRLQIGDTADTFNQLKVSIGDCHTKAIGIDGISIADQDSAAKAIDAIKSAINYVSDVRGTLGATQNRLDHTINNLSVMTENIQDAESTIRDTDVAAEMMEYTKNNILIQSAQAMLAQANQVPQGVLQLLQ